ncbi:type II secretion system F family protein [Williamsia phyllosphaerae]|uniref:Type II secretion system protein GspF domain-containing protein n=1 Tax=Williamsia phyllosphaerae TaxID=885042 RepID=A0ABQ1U578_9NOCA|nr:type II secretion system F family protein [Williamsia phyllosphaerae]GGF10682.1 hypothetical protein GCM10007298_03330 [Williamsia phyllosphaerae]
MSPLLAGVAAMLLLWPQTRPTSRLRTMAGRVGGRRGLPGAPVLVAAAACAAVLVVVGPAATIAAGIAAMTAHHRMTLQRRTDELDAGLGLLLDAVAVMIAELSVGAHPARACRQAADDVSRGGVGEAGAVAGVLTQMAGRAELGGDVAEGIEGAGLSHQSSWDRVAVAWRTAERHGLPMADLLGAVRDDLVARRRFAERTRAALAGARATAAVLALLPLLGIGLGQAMGARPLAILSGGGIGGALLVVGVSLVATGLWWTERITAKVMRP